MKRRTLLTTAVVLITGAFAPAIPAGTGGDPATFINNLSNQVHVLVRNTSPEQKLAGFRELFREYFDVPGLGRFVLGRFWRILTPSEQQEFLVLFENYVVHTYSERLSEYDSDGGVLRVTGSRPDPDGAIVSSEIIRVSGRADQGRLAPDGVEWRVQNQRRHHRWHQYGGDRALRTRGCG